MAFPARFAVVKSPPEAYEQRLKSSEKYSEETVSSLLERAAVDVEGSDVVLVNEEVQAAAAALDAFIYGKEGQEGGKDGQTADENVEKPDVNMENPGENTEKPNENTQQQEGNARNPEENTKKPVEATEKPDEKSDEKPEDGTNGDGEKQAHEGEDQEMKEATSADA